MKDIEANIPQNIKSIVEIAFQAGADAELEACDDMVARTHDLPVGFLTSLRRKSTPPTLKAQALEQLMDCEVHYTIELSIIRRALEALPNDN